MRLILLLSSTIILFCLTGCKVKSFYGKSEPISHEIWNDLMVKHVNDQGWLDYQGVQRDSDQFITYLELLNTHHPNPETWNRNERMAYWINAYNAYTVQLILDNYPIASIKDIKKGIPFVNGVWDIVFIEIEGQKYSLNNIEHGILRPKFDEPRIHFAINCASYSCPVLRQGAFTPDDLNAQLDEAAKGFLSDTRRNKLDPSQPQLSKIFSWFKGDFTKNGSLIDFVNKYTLTPIQKDAKVDFLEYEWSLNDSAIQN